MNVRRIIDISLLGTFDATRALAELRRAGLIEPLGVEVQRIAVYRTVPAPPQEPREKLDELGVNTIFLASPSALKGLMRTSR